MPATPVPDERLHPNVRGLHASPTLAIHQRSAELIAAGKEVYRLGFGQSPFPVPEPVVEALRAHAAEKDYLPVRGLPRLRDAVAEHTRRTHGSACTAEDVLIGPGSKELLFLLQLVCDAELVLPTPTWVSYAPQARLNGRPVALLKTCAEDRWQLDPAVLDAHCRAAPGRRRILVLTYPSNPTGASPSRERLRAIAAVARAHGVLVVADEIYGLLHFAGAHASIVEAYPEGTVLASGLSKWCGAGGWRLGYVVAPRSLRVELDAMAAAASETFSAVSAPIQHAAVRAFRDDDGLTDYRRQARRVLQAVGQHVVAALRDAGAEVVAPDGGFYVFPDFGAFAERASRDGIASSEALCERLLADSGVALLPGEAFGRPAEELTARLAFVDFDGGQALAAARQVPADEPLGPAFLEARCGRLLSAMTRLGAWLDGLGRSAVYGSRTGTSS